MTAQLDDLTSTSAKITFLPNNIGLGSRSHCLYGNERTYYLLTWTSLKRICWDCLNEESNLSKFLHSLLEECLNKTDVSIACSAMADTLNQRYKRNEEIIQQKDINADTRTNTIKENIKIFEIITAINEFRVDNLGEYLAIPVPSQ